MVLTFISAIITIFTDIIDTLIKFLQYYETVSSNFVYDSDFKLIFTEE